MKNQTTTDQIIADTLARTVEVLAQNLDQQHQLIDRLTTPTPSEFPQFIQACAPILTDLGIKLFERLSPRPIESIGPVERRVVAVYRAAHAKLMADLDERRAAARNEDEAARPWTPPMPPSAL